MAHALMLLGTHSGAGKSLLATAFCRLLRRRGLRVAPFKAQNMSNNAGVTPEGGEMGRAQIVQAEAAGVPPHTDMNPVLLKPEAGGRSQVVLSGRLFGTVEAANWRAVRRILWDEVRAAYDRLAGHFDAVVLEGAGSPAEVNLKDGDIVNLRMARHARAPCLLVGDIDRGGVFAALAGTLFLLEPEERQQIRGFLINKLRGDPALLGDGTKLLQQKAYGVPTLGVIPFLPGLRLPQEDAVALDDAAPADAAGAAVDVAVVQLPHVANFDDFAPLEAEPGVGVRYVRRADEVGDPDAVILPGTKSTLADLAWLRQVRLDREVRRLRWQGRQVVGICGGFQILGEWLEDPDGVEGPVGGSAEGLGLLPASTRFARDKHTHQARLRLPGGEELDGYEIHAGETCLPSDAAPFGLVARRDATPVQVADGARSADGRVWGTYLHGLFANDAFRQRWLSGLGWSGSATSSRARVEAEFDRLSDVVEGAVDVPAVLEIMGLG
ncbi:MAG: cobyric acid synthase [Candidatus Latescibacterota bacterium]